MVLSHLRLIKQNSPKPKPYVEAVGSGFGLKPTIDQEFDRDLDTR